MPSALEHAVAVSAATVVELPARAVHACMRDSVQIRYDHKDTVRTGAAAADSHDGPAGACGAVLLRLGTTLRWRVARMPPGAGRAAAAAFRRHGRREETL